MMMIMINLVFLVCSMRNTVKLYLLWVIHPGCHFYAFDSKENDLVV